MNYYLENFAFRPSLIGQAPSEQLGMVIVIPCANEENLINSLNSLLLCEKPTNHVEIIVVINSSENAVEKVLLQNQKTQIELQEWITNLEEDWLDVHAIVEKELPAKHAGVGLARKIGMDEAVRRFEQVEYDGPIICFDADASCDSNYLVELEKHFKTHPYTPACSIHFEHPVEGDEFEDRIYEGIIQYELHLRYYKNGMGYAGLPYAFHTIGSSMAVRSSAYQKQNGMNKRKAGEDFYFLQKLIPLGGFTEVKTTKVIPSPRVSDRVPFGTGKAMQDWLNDDSIEMNTYNIQSFDDLKVLNECVGKLYEQKLEEIPHSLAAFFSTIDFEQQLPKLIQNSRSETHFVELFYKWFNAFRVLKFMHFARDEFYPNQLISDASKFLLNKFEVNVDKDFKALLEAFRKLDLAS